MRLAFLYVDAGKGHLTPAIALSDAFQRLGHETTVENLLLVCKAPVFNWMSKHNWRFLLHFPRLEHLVDSNTDIPANARSIRFAATHFHGVKDFKDWYDMEKPDCIVITHFAGANVITPIVRKLHLDIPVFVYAADVFFNLKVGVNPQLDKLYICTQIGKDIVIHNGQPASSIKICPFPLKSSIQLFTPLEKKEAREKLGLKNQFTVLLNLGGEGIGNTDFLEEVVNRKLPWQIVTVGKLSKSTTQAYKRFRKRYPDFNLRTPGFVENINEYICACDVQAGKAGANALMESLYLKRPFLVSELLYTALPTKEFMALYAVGWTENDPKKQISILQSYYNDENAQKIMHQRFSTLPLTFDSDAFAKMILSDIEEYHTKKSHHQR
jgi:processive 1,2-diacylglycerol beta-glucosyltransferase